jgi:hypothetical protein
LAEDLSDASRIRILLSAAVTRYTSETRGSKAYTPLITGLC